jgi:Family of unknown function (DUF5681)
MADRDASYEIGYGKPPSESRFQKGASGNPKGRPKGSKNLATIFLKESRERVRINGPRGPRTITKLEATAKQLGNKSARGDARAIDQFLHWVRHSEESASSGSGPLPMNELDRTVMEGLLHRLAASKPNEEESK